MTDSKNDEPARPAPPTGPSAMWLLAVLPLESFAILLLASLGWPGLGASAALLAAQIGGAIYFSS